LLLVVWGVVVAVHRLLHPTLSQGLEVLVVTQTLVVVVVLDKHPHQIKVFLLVALAVLVSSFSNGHLVIHKIKYLLSLTQVSSEYLTA